MSTIEVKTLYRRLIYKVEPLIDREQVLFFYTVYTGLWDGLLND